MKKTAKKAYNEYVPPRVKAAVSKVVARVKQTRVYKAAVKKAKKKIERAKIVLKKVKNARRKKKPSKKTSVRTGTRNSLLNLAKEGIIRKHLGNKNEL